MEGCIDLPLVIIAGGRPNMYIVFPNEKLRDQVTVILMKMMTKH